MKLEVGMYVRTKKGIRKIIEIDEDNNYYIDKPYINDFRQEIDCITDSCIICEPSHNIIDLIEENDYIRIITSAYFEPVYYSYGKLVIRDDIPIENYSNDFVREVITKEQFEAMAYKVGE